MVSVAAAVSCVHTQTFELTLDAKLICNVKIKFIMVLSESFSHSAFSYVEIGTEAELNRLSMSNWTLVSIKCSCSGQDLY